MKIQWRIQKPTAGDGKKYRVHRSRLDMPTARIPLRRVISVQTNRVGADTRKCRRGDGWKPVCSCLWGSVLNLIPLRKELIALTRMRSVRPSQTDGVVRDRVSRMTRFERSRHFSALPVRIDREDYEKCCGKNAPPIANQFNGKSKHRMRHIRRRRSFATTLGQPRSVKNENLERRGL